MLAAKNESLSSEEVWHSYRDLHGLIWKHLNQDVKSTLPIQDLQNILRKYKQHFFNLLKPPPKNAKKREELKNSVYEGENFKGMSSRATPKAYYEEAIIFSDMFGMNEGMALNLIQRAQLETPNHSGLARGLIAVLMYYESRKCLVNSLFYLVQGRKGIQWQLNTKPGICSFVTEYTDQLMEGGLLLRIMELIRTMDWTFELDKLQANAAIGDAKHRRQIFDLFNDTKSKLAEIMFTWSSQSGLPKDVTLELMQFMKRCKLESEASGSLDNITMYMQMALMGAMDLSAFNSRESEDELVQHLPILSDTSLLPAIMEEFPNISAKWEHEGLQSLTIFNLAVCLSTMKLLPQNFTFQDYISREDNLVDQAIVMNVFDFIHTYMLSSDLLYKEQFIFKRIHSLITDFIVHMYPKVKELRMKANDIYKTLQIYKREGVEAPKLPNYFETFLLCIGKLYLNNKHDPEYTHIWWCHVDVNPLLTPTIKTPARSVALFKFVKLAGEMLDPRCFVPFLKMLTGLSSTQQTARNCFCLLKQPGTFLPTSIALDHFFNSFRQYYTSLKTEIAEQSDAAYIRRPPFSRGVSPQELEGLQAVLELIRAVAEHDSMTRVAIAEHATWKPIALFLGFVTCPIPYPLKAEMMLALATLSKSSVIARLVWPILETSQVLATAGPQVLCLKPRDLRAELNEVESRNGEYPLTRAFLKLIDVLTDTDIPTKLGISHRIPGFYPYLDYIIDVVYLNYRSRTYRDVNERWEVVISCFKLFEKFLRKYSPRLSDFSKKPKTEFCKPPGFHIMLALNTRSDFLSIMLDILDEVTFCLESHLPFTGEEKTKESVLLVLKIFNRAVNLQNTFHSKFSLNEITSYQFIGLSNHLLCLNPRSDRPDYCITLGKIMSYHCYMPRHALEVVKLLVKITSVPNLHQKLMNIILSTNKEKQILRAAIIECLDVKPINNQDIYIDIKKEILKLLKQCIHFSAPNLTHFLLGFDTKRDVSKTEFQFPGINQQPRTCLHSLFSIFDAIVEKETDKPVIDVIESSYHLLYLLVANQKSSGPVLRFLRMNRDFFKKHLKRSERIMLNEIKTVNQASWLLKSLAIELKTASNLKQISYLKSLVSFLVHISESSDDTTLLKQILHIDLAEIKGIPTGPPPPPPVTLDLTSMTSSANPRFSSLGEPLQGATAQVEAMNTFFSPSTPKPPSSPGGVHVFGVQNPNMQTSLQTGTSRLSRSPSRTTSSYGGTIRRSSSEESRTPTRSPSRSISRSPSPSDSPQGKRLRNPAPKVDPKELERAEHKKKFEEGCAALRDFVNSWRQVAQVLVLYMPTEVLSDKEQQIFSIFLLQSLLRAASSKAMLSDIANYLSATVLLLMDNIKRHHSNTYNLMAYQIGVMKYILDDIIRWVTNTDPTGTVVRINLYAALTTFLNLTGTDSISVDDLESQTPKNLTDLSILMHKTFKTPDGGGIFNKRFDRQFMEILCQDCVGGPDVCRVIAMTTIGQLICNTEDTSWINFLVNTGHLNEIIYSIKDSDKDLISSLTPEYGHMRPIFLYSAKMTLITRIASVEHGAEALLENHIFNALRDMTVFRHHPEIPRESIVDWNDDYFPTPQVKYSQIFIPTLDICNTLLSTLGSDNESLLTHIMGYLFSINEVVELILRSGAVDLAPCFLKELSALTSVISRCAHNDLNHVLENPAFDSKQQSQLYRFQRLMLHLIPNFELNEKTVKLITSRPNPEEFQQLPQRFLYVLQILSNLLLYARSVISNNDVKHGGLGILFCPSLRDPKLQMSFQTPNTEPSEQDISLCCVIQQLVHVVDITQQIKTTHDNIARKIGEVKEMSLVDLRTFVEAELEGADINTKKERAFANLVSTLQHTSKQLEYCIFIKEHCLLIIWGHLDYYVSRILPRTEMKSTLSVDSMEGHEATSVLESTFKIPPDAISSLKNELAILFNDRFCKNIVNGSERDQIAHDMAMTCIRKIKGLVQVPKRTQ